MPNRSWISRSNRLAGNDRRAREGTDRARGVEPHLQLGPPVRRPGAEHVDDPQRIAGRRGRRPRRAGSPRASRRAASAASSPAVTWCAWRAAWVPVAGFTRRRPGRRRAGAAAAARRTRRGRRRPAGRRRAGRRRSGRCLGPALGRRVAEEEVPAVRHHRGEDDRHADQRDRRRPAEAGGDLGAQHVQLAGEQAERRQAQQGDQAEAEDPAEHRAAGQQGGNLRDLAGALGEQDLAGGQEQHPLGEAVAEDVQQDRGDRQRGPGRGAEGDQPHVLDAVVGEHPLVVPLGDAAATPRRRGTPGPPTTSRARGYPGPSAPSAIALNRSSA